MPLQPACRRRPARATATAVLGAGLVLSGALAPVTAAPVRPVWTQTSSVQLAAPLAPGSYTVQQSRVADLDADGDLDVVTAVPNAGLVVEINQGAGALASPVMVPYASQRIGFAVGDVDGDGHPDVVSRTGNLLVVNHGGPTGLSAPVTTPLPGSSAGTALDVVDVDADGHLDVVTALSGGAVGVLLGDGAGAFTPSPGPTVPVSFFPRALQAVDVNGDARPDLVAFDVNAALVVAPGLGDGGFGPASTSPGNNAILHDFGTGDVDGDGDLDVVFASSSNTQGLFLLRGDGAGGFSSRVTIAPVYGQYAGRLADLDGDGNLDVATLVRTGSAIAELHAYLGNGDGTFVDQLVQPTVLGADVLAADLTGDGRPELRTVGDQDRTARVWTNAAPVAPVVTQQPQSEQVVLGGTTVLTVGVTGTPEPNARWQVDQGAGFTETGSTGTSFTTYPADATTDGWRYRAVVTNSAGEATSAAATITHLPLPVVTQQPVGTTVTSGTPFTLVASADGDDAVRWETSLAGSPWTTLGDPSETLVVDPVTTADDGRQYRAVFTNLSGETTSATATVTVLPYASVVTLQPLDTWAVSGQTASFTSEGEGDPAPAVQWEVSTDGGTTFGPVTGGTSTTLDVAAVHALDGALYRAAFTNVGGTAYSDVATLHVDPIGPSITQQPQDATVATGQPVTFTAAATGDPVPTVRWQVSPDDFQQFEDLPGETATTLQLTPTGSSNHHRYRAVFTGADGDEVATDEAELTVTWTPAAPAQDVTAVQTGPGQITVTWTASPGGGSNPVTGYAVGYGTSQWGNGTEVDADTFSMVFDGLAEGDYQAVVIPITVDAFDDGITNRVFVPVTVGPWEPTLPLPPGTPTTPVGGGFGGGQPVGQRPDQAAPVRTGDERLARTGADPADLVDVAAGSLLLGAALLLVSRRNRRPTRG